MKDRWEFDEVHMPYRKYAGSPIHEIPEDYLVWIHQNLKNMSRPLKLAVRKELERRHPGRFALPGRRYV
jgi:hypothetical protein